MRKLRISILLNYKIEHYLKMLIRLFRQIYSVPPEIRQKLGMAIFTECFIV